jgi:hypothetical protein
MLEALGLSGLGPTLPNNVGASRSLPEHIVREIETVALADRLVAHLLDEFIREHGMNGPDGSETAIRLSVRAELVITGSTPPAVQEPQEPPT